MSTYFISDVHGEYELFCRLLDKIKFSASDTLWVLGDFFDKGNHSIRLLKLIATTPQIYALIGNHEHAFLMYYAHLMREFDGQTHVDSILHCLQQYFKGESETLSWELVDYVENLPWSHETADFIAVHAGLELDASSQIIPLAKQDPNHFIYSRNLVSTTPKNSKPVLFGHTPCYYTNQTGHIIKTPHSTKSITSTHLADFSKIRLDNGASHTHLLGCLRLNDMTEFYIRR